MITNRISSLREAVGHILECNDLVGQYDNVALVIDEASILDELAALGIDPKDKTLLFSDSLDFDKAQQIYEYFKDICKVSFGIGTFITNDTCVDPLNIVIKLQYVNGRPVAKLSDNPEKAMCQDTEYLEYLKSAVKRRIGE